MQGQAPGGEWIWVETADGTQGWISVQVIEENPALKSAPVMEPEDVQVLRAKVTDNLGLPITGLQFSLTQGDQSTDATTDAKETCTSSCPPIPPAIG